MDDIENRIKKAQSDSSELELLISDYLPLLKKQAGAAASGILEYEDRLSLAMLTFISCVRQYTEKRGSFISFFSVCFHNRITDEIRRQNLYLKNVQTLTPDSAELETAAGKASLDAYDREQERLSLCEERSTAFPKPSAFTASPGRIFPAFARSSRAPKPRAVRRPLPYS